MRRLIPLLPLALLGACPGPSTDELPVWTPDDHSHPTVAGDGRTQAGQSGAPGVQPSEEEAVALLWAEACSGCHGEQGLGDGPAASDEMAMQDLSDPQWQDTTGDEAIAAVIAEGRGAMPAYGPGAPSGRRLNQRGIRALVDHVRRLRADGT